MSHTMNRPKDYVGNVKNREKKNLGVTSVDEIARGINHQMDTRCRNKHLWCYSEKALNEVAEKLRVLDVIDNSNFHPFTSFEALYDYIQNEIGEIKGVGPVEVYDVSLCLGERMKPQVVPMVYVYVHGKLVESVRHLLALDRAHLSRVKKKHRIEVTYFGSLYQEIQDKQYAARAIEEWLCNEHKVLLSTKSLKLNNRHEIQSS